MTWRRIAPWVIGVVALVAIFIDLPRTTLGLDWLPTQVGGVEFKTVLGLDLEGGIRVTLEAEPESDEPITPTDMETARTIIERAARLKAGGARPPAAAKKKTAPKTATAKSKTKTAATKSRAKKPTAKR